MAKRSFRLFFSRYVLHLFFLRFYYTHHVLFDHYFRETFSISFLRFYYHIMFFSIIIFAIRSASRFLRFYETQYVLFDYFFRETFCISFFCVFIEHIMFFSNNYCHILSKFFYNKPRCSNHVIFCASNLF